MQQKAAGNFAEEALVRRTISFFISLISFAYFLLSFFFFSSF